MQSDYSGLWQDACARLKQDFTSEGKLNEFSRWFTGVACIRGEGSKLFLSLPSAFHGEKLKKQGYIKSLEAHLLELSGEGLEIAFEVTRKNILAAQPEEPAKEDASASATKSPKAVRKDYPNIRPDYNFDTFVPGDNSAFAYNAAQAISKNPGKAYNPVLFYGGVGLGKTHLIQAIGNTLYQNGAGKIIYVPAETFTNDFINSLQTKTTSNFKSRYRNADVLLIDDIHFFQGKVETQEELFYTFDTLYHAYKQIVFTCDRPISELKDVTDRLKSRFSRGLPIDLQPPKYETRRAILAKKLELQGKTVPSDVLDLIAQNVETNVRDLERALTKILAYGDLINKNITVDIARQQLRDVFNAPNAMGITVETVQRAVAEHYGISLNDLRGQKRNKAVVQPRHLAMYIAGELTQTSTTDIGREFGGRDHSTVMYSQEKIANAIKTDSSLDALVQFLTRKTKEYKGK
ncbi:MAG: chromosomal replication initiator protein DnaA [Treponema sp.]|jgi:chromosomal replication initiator protein|nr:chromosomal replication initiator protein DnaA [Treponema sp.]